MSGKLQLEGSFVAIITPFTHDGKSVDYDALGRLVEKQVEGGVDGVVPVGTTGESPTLSIEEQKKVIQEVVKKVNGRIKVVAGTGSNCTEKTVEMTKYAQSVGADAALVVVPYYNKPTQEGLYLHFKEVASVGLPIVLYNIPGRSGQNMTPSTIVRLAHLQNVVAVKEASGSLDAVSEIISLSKKQGVEITVLSGDDSLTLPMISVGARGVISVIGNLTPRLLKDFVKAALDNDFVKAKELHYELFRLSKVMFLETNPIPIKTALSILGVCSDAMRLPLSPMTPENKQTLITVLREAKLVQQ
eukprot:TRINITY_DN5814_c0_g1_i1.p1 TRINITY_DN5814_c0_g1~~TRINITY_DN5814_c0_g1_i1.p1  ORF type:complete len:302 (-),score=62.55 TRINITY_DN5814_c0_g1_i1:71-976(-)